MWDGEQQKLHDLSLTASLLHDISVLEKHGMKQQKRSKHIISTTFSWHHLESHEILLLCADEYYMQVNDTLSSTPL